MKYTTDPFFLPFLLKNLTVPAMPIKKYKPAKKRTYGD